MGTLKALSLAVLMAGGLAAQNHGNAGFSNATPRMTGNFGNVVFPGGTAATSPGVTRTFGNVAFPGGGGPRMVVPGSVVDPSFGLRLGATVGGGNPLPNQGNRGFRRAAPVVAYPVYVSGFYDTPYPAPAQAQQPATQNVTVVYPPQPPPVVMYPGDAPQAAPQGPAEPESNFRIYQAPHNEPQEPAEAARYLFAFKDHTICSAVAYWVDGDTLHYFTQGNKHNQASISLLDRELTERLNKESGTPLNLGPGK